MTADSSTMDGSAHRWPEHPVVGCIDGGDLAYVEHEAATGIIPDTRCDMNESAPAAAHGTMPSFTCRNDMSIVTRRPATVRGTSRHLYQDHLSTFGG